LRVLAALPGGSDMGEEEAEEQRMTLITKLLSNSAVIDYDGAVQVRRQKFVDVCAHEIILFCETLANATIESTRDQKGKST
jgi:hypothetical protein